MVHACEHHGLPKLCHMLLTVRQVLLAEYYIFIFHYSEV